MNKTLLQILLDELPKRGGWPDGADCAVRVLSRTIRFTNAPVEIISRGHLFGTPYRFFSEFDLDVNIPASANPFSEACIVTKEQYEAAIKEK